MPDRSASTPEIPHVILKPRRALPFFNRHPWVFSGAVNTWEGNPQPGDEVVVLSHKREFIARGLFNPHSNIKVRLYTWDEQTPLDDAFFSERLDSAIALRRMMFPNADGEAAYRLIFSEADGLSGLIVDRYGDWLIVQITSLAIAARRDMLLSQLKTKLRPAGIWLRTEKGIRESEGLELSDALIDGAEPPRPLFINEHGIRYGVDIVEGQKTGFYLDQRDNRAAFSQHVLGDRVLDLFCYTGGFGMAAVMRGGAKQVLGVDVSEPALAMARANVELNEVASRFRFEKAKAFDALERLKAAGEKFDTVILDPPKLARNRAGLKNALRGYYSLNQLAVDVLKPDGLLVTCSCSGHVSRDQFQEMLATVSLNANRRIQILESRGQAADHPMSVHCVETSYLKCCICRVRDTEPGSTNQSSQQAGQGRAGQGGST